MPGVMDGGKSLEFSLRVDATGIVDLTNVIRERFKIEQIDLMAMLCAVECHCTPPIT